MVLPHPTCGWRYPKVIRRGGLEIWRMEKTSLCFEVCCSLKIRMDGRVVCYSSKKREVGRSSPRGVM